ncbi:hypothetical protein L7F22_019211 [Adiantum nelumboides]|nr:hypothetical protein [Adiantum nelumboides]
MSNSLPHFQDQISNFQSRFASSQYPSYNSSSSSSALLNEDSQVNTNDSINSFQRANESEGSNDASDVVSHSRSISLSEPIQSPVAMPPYMIPSGGGGGSSSASEINYGGGGGNGESENMSDSHVQMLLQQPLTISSVEVAAFHAREMSRSGSGSRTFPAQYQQAPYQNEQSNPSSSRINTPPQQQQQQQQIPLQGSNRKNFQLNLDNQRTGTAFAGNLSSSASVSGMPFTFANQTYDMTPTQEQRPQQFQRNENIPESNLPSQNNVQTLNFARPQYPFSGGLPNFNRASSNPISTLASSSFSASPASSSNQPFRSITHRRVPAACNFCRMRKLRCDGNTPCRQCARRMIECIYSEAAETRRQRRATVSTYPPSNLRRTTSNSNEVGRQQAQESPFYSSSIGLTGNSPINFQLNQRQNWSSNDQFSNRAEPSNSQAMQSQQFQQIQFAQQQQQRQYLFRSRPTELGPQQDNNLRANVSESNTQIAGLPANWMPVSLHAPRRAFPGGSTNPTSTIVTQDSNQPNIQKTSPFLMSTHNDWSIPSTDERNRYQDPNQQSQQPNQGNKN